MTTYATSNWSKSGFDWPFGIVVLERDQLSLSASGPLRVMVPSRPRRRFMIGDIQSVARLKRPRWAFAVLLGTYELRTKNPKSPRLLITAFPGARRELVAWLHQAGVEVQE